MNIEKYYKSLGKEIERMGDFCWEQVVDALKAVNFEPSGDFEEDLEVVIGIIGY